MPADGIYWCTAWLIQECLLICYYVGRSSLLVHIPADGVYWRAVCLIRGCFLIRSVLVIDPCWFTCQLMVFTDVLVLLSRDIF